MINTTQIIVLAIVFLAFIVGATQNTPQHLLFNGEKEDIGLEQRIKVLNDRIVDLQSQLIDKIYLQLSMGAFIVILLWRTILMAESLGRSREAASSKSSTTMGLEMEETTEYQES